MPGDRHAFPTVMLFRARLGTHTHVCVLLMPGRAINVRVRALGAGPRELDAGQLDVGPRVLDVGPYA